VEGSLLFAAEPEFFGALENADAQARTELLNIHRRGALTGENQRRFPHRMPSR